MKKHAYLIMAHNDFYILEKLLKKLDNDNIDIYLHIDKKVKNFDFNKYEQLLSKSKLIYIKRMDVRWGSVGQIKCVLNLLEASSINNYDYYHLLSGVDLPIKSIEEINQFFEDKNNEFVDFDDLNSISDFYLERIKLYHLCTNNLRNKNKIIKKLSNSIRFRTSSLEKKLKINRIKKVNIEFRKGANWFSITDDLVKYILEQKEFLKYFKKSYCADELFLQTIIYNSKFKEKIYLNKGKTDNLRYIDWTRGNPTTLEMIDYESLKKSDKLFARKFDSSKDKKIIDKL